MITVKYLILERKGRKEQATDPAFDNLVKPNICMLASRDNSNQGTIKSGWLSQSDANTLIIIFADSLRFINQNQEELEKIGYEENEGQLILYRRNGEIVLRAFVEEEGKFSVHILQFPQEQKQEIREKFEEAKKTVQLINSHI